MDKNHIRELIKNHGLRVTAPRLAVIRLLADSRMPLSYAEVLSHLGDTDWDDATIFRNLVKLRDAGIVSVVSKAKGMDRYAFADPHKGDHLHPHFVCDQCGRVTCIEGDFSVSVSTQDNWSQSLKSAKVQLSGDCPDCLTS